jgi:hypothetical protein
MAVEKTALDHSAAMSDARISLDRAVTELQEVFQQCPKATLKRRLKRLAKAPAWPEPSPAE